MRVHPTAVVEDGAELGADVAIGPFCHVGPRVVLEDGVRATVGWLEGEGAVRAAA